MKAAIYCRLSDEDKDKQFATDDSNSIKNQKAMLLQYAMEKGWEIYNIYSDDDYAGADRNRPEFCRLIRDAEQRQFDIVLCKTQSRFTRELELVEKYIHGLFPIWGIRFIGVVDNADTANKGNKKSRQINGLVNEWYLEDLSENIRSVLTNRRQNGFHIGTTAVYGYDKDPEQKGHLIIDEEAAAVVREIFSLYAKGCGKLQICHVLNGRGIPNPTEYKLRKGQVAQMRHNKHSTLWTQGTLTKMLRNEMYLGNMVQGRQASVSYKCQQKRDCPPSEWFVVPNTHEPIIERELWNRVQELAKQKVKPQKDGTIGLFARKARCANCGFGLRTTYSGKRKYLKCSKRHFDINSCPGAYISEARLESMVLQELNRLAELYLDGDAMAENLKMNSVLQARQAKLMSDVEGYQKKISECSRGISALYLDKIKEVVSERDFIELSKELAAQRAIAEQGKVEAEQNLILIEERLAQGDNREEIIRRYSKLERLSREAVEVLIDYISVGTRIPGSKQVPIEIHWNF